MIRSLATFLTLGIATALPSQPIMARDDGAGCAAPPQARKLIIGTPFQILTANFDGSKFSITGNHTAEGTAPSWMVYKDPSLLWAVNENANDIDLFTLDSSKSNPTPKSTAQGSAGVVFLEFNKDKSRMVGAAYGSGKIDVWDVDSVSGELKLHKTITVPGNPNPAQGAHHPHQALLDPTGRFFVIPNLGGDTVLVLDGESDKWEITGNVTLPTGTGPRHGGFLTAGDKHYYALASELSNQLFLFELSYPGDTIAFKQLQAQSTYGTTPPANASSAAAGELVVAANQRDVYVSNRVSGNETDSIAHFAFAADHTTLDYQATISSGGLRPRMFSLSADKEQSLAFVANQGGESGLVAFKRSLDTGKLDPTPVASMPSQALVAPQLAATDLMGPQFVLEI
ncbi:putative isomerase YbhE [Hypomontagnella monticulosa]|nr:putative isomerase YbhE [Hypomontagnella monticulosa]